MSRYLTRERDMSEVTMTTPSTRPGERCQGGPVLALLSRLEHGHFVVTSNTVAVEIIVSLIMRL